MRRAVRQTSSRPSLRNYSTAKVPITLAEGDGIGPEITRSTVDILSAAGARIETHPIVVGEKMFLSGYTSGISPDSWDVLRSNKILLKGPITTPQGKGYKSLNVSIRKTLGLFANVRPCVSYSPFVPTNFPTMDTVIVRENEEDLYAGIEHRQTQQVTQCLKLITAPGTEKIVRYAFEYARNAGRKKVTVMIKDNIMKITDGLFHRIFKEIGEEYPEIKKESIIIDIGSAKLAVDPTRFDVIVCPNLYGDIISDIAAEITGSVGLGGSANVGMECAMFEAIHGSAPDISGKDIANPSGMILSSVMMLNHIGQSDVANTVHNAWLRTIEEGLHTVDIKSEHTKKVLGTKDFTKAVVANLGKTPERLAAVNYTSNGGNNRIDLTRFSSKQKHENKELHGVDVFLDWTKGTAEELGALLSSKVAADGLKLTLITNRGVKVWPQGLPETSCVDHWRCRFKSEDGKPISHNQILSVLGRVQREGLDFIKTENLYYFDGQPGFTLGQGE